MSDLESYLVDCSVLRTPNILSEIGINVLKTNYHEIEVHSIGYENNLKIELYQYTIAANLSSGSDIIYTITIPHILCNNKPMLMLSKFKSETDIGLSNIFFKLNDNYNPNLVKETEMDYRNNLLLTSFNSMEIINVMTDKQFINDLNSSLMVNKLVKDKMKLFKVLNKSFINEVMNYTEYHRIKNYNYIMKFKSEKFNLLNLFSYSNENENFVHITFNLERSFDIHDRYIRGYNFIQKKS